MIGHLWNKGASFEVSLCLSSVNRSGLEAILSLSFPFPYNGQSGLRETELSRRLRNVWEFTFYSWKCSIVSTWLALDVPAEA
jgi:hypothetical protein